MRTRKFALAAVLTAAAAAMLAVPALAHDVLIWHGNDTSTVWNVHSQINACDNEADGNGVRAHWRDSAGNVSIGDWDPDGSGGPACGTDNLPSSAVQFRLCENNVGCTPWTNE